LAAYLGLDKAAITRLTRSHRPLSEQEKILARAFFSIVPETADPEFMRAVRTLRAAKLRKGIGFVLAERILGDTERISTLPPDSLGAILNRIKSGDLILRADQLVALCRALDLDLPEVVLNGTLSIHRWPRLDAGIAELITKGLTATSGERAADAYEFGRGAESVQPIHATGRKNSVVIRSTDKHSDEFLACEPFLLTSNAFAPPFERGQTIYLAGADIPPRKGDYVAVILQSADHAEKEVVLGKLLYVTPDLVCLDSSRETTEILLTSTMRIRRIVFCRL
jgi:hypothetical protein